MYAKLHFRNGFHLNLILALGISYIAHPQANPTRVADFQNIERITTSTLQIQTDIDCNKLQALEDPVADSCSCNEMKTLLKLKVVGNTDDLTITCNGSKTANSIADLVDGYCRIVNNTEISYWDRYDSNIALEKISTRFISLDEFPEYPEQSQQTCANIGKTKSDICKVQHIC